MESKSVNKKMGRLVNAEKLENILKNIEAIAKKEITHNINKIELKISKLNEKRDKLLERYKSLGK